MADPNSILESVNKVLDIVDHAVSTNNYSNMSGQIRDLFKPSTQQDFYDSVHRQYTQGQYRGGHTENAQNTDAERKSAASQNRTGGYSYEYRSKGMEAAECAQAARAAARNAAQTEAHTVPVYQNFAMAKARENPLTAENEYFRKTDSAVGSKVMFGFGIGGLILFGSIALTAGTITFLSGGGFAAAVTAFSAAIAAGFGFLTFFGNKDTARAERYAAYRRILAPNLYADVEEIAKKVNAPVRLVRKELKGMTEMGFFKQGHFDNKETCFIASDDLYAQYQETQRNADALRQQQKNETDSIPEDVRAVLDKGNAYIRAIRQANDAIADPGVSDKLSRMENIVTRIFEQVRRQPDLAHNLSMFMDYYLPTTAKLISAYQEMDAQPVQGENIKSAKKEIEDSLDTINDAFERLLDSFFRDRALDVSTDISVMKTVLKQQGLTPDDLSAMTADDRQQEQMEKGPTLEELRKQIDAQEKVKEQK